MTATAGLGTGTFPDDRRIYVPRLGRSTFQALSVLVALGAVAAPAGAETWEDRLRQLDLGAAPRVDLAGLQLAQAVSQEFDISAQPLIPALLAFSEATDIQLFFDATLARDLASPGVSGTHAPEAALRLLLAGTGLTYRFTNPTTVTLEKLADSGDGATLDPVTAEGQAAQEVAGGPVDGYVATRSATGTKTDTPIIEVPQSIAVITRDQMDARNVQREGDAFYYTAGVFAEPYGGDPRPSFDAPVIRGFDQSTTGAYRDGLREASGVWSRFISEFYGLERVDVLKGPASVLYGQSGPGGIVDKISKRPPDEPLYAVDLWGGSYDRRQGGIDLGGPLDASGEFLYRVTGMARDSDTQYEYDDDHAVPDDRKYVAPAFSWRPTEDTTLTLQADYLHNRTAGPFTVTLTGAQPTKILSGEPDYNRSVLDQYTAGYRLEHRFDNALAVRQTLRYGTLDFDYRNMTISGVLADGHTLTRNASRIDEQLDGLSLDNQAQLDATTGPLAHKILLGFDYQWSEYASRTRSGAGPTLDLLNPVYGAPVATPTTVTSSSHQERDQLGLYAQDQVKFGDGWILTFGGREDWAAADTDNRLTGVKSEMYDQAFTGRAGLGYLFEFGLAPYVSYAESFLPTAGADFGGNPFEPTTGQQYEAGIKYQPAGFDSFFTVALYDLTQQNVLTPDPAHPATSFRVQTGEVRSRGIEIQGVASLAEGLDVTASYTYQDLEVTKSNSTNLHKTLPWTADEMASLWVDYEVQSGALAGIGAGGGVRYVGETFADAANTVKNDPYTLFDVALHYELGGLSANLEGVRLALNASNLFDKDYVICTATTNCQWGQGRTIILGLKYLW